MKNNYPKAKSFLNAANEYLYASDLLTHTDRYKKTLTLRRPTLYLLGHGIEALFKYELIQVGLNDKQLKSLNHNLYQLWNRCEISLIREEVKKTAQLSWRNAYHKGLIDSGKYKENPISLLEEQISILSDLYGRETNYSLKYEMSDGTKAPRAPFLISCFLPVAQKLAESSESAEHA